MSQDLGPLISGWAFNADELQIRVITGDDGAEKIQIRVDLGLLQLELAGRPDGLRPFDCESLLEHYESLQSAAEAESQEFSLDHEACNLLMQEGLQYYRRYLSAFHLQRYEIVTRDTLRNLRLFRFVVRHAVRHRDKIEFDQYRPYVTMMHTRAVALMALGQGDHALALREIDKGIEQIRQFLQEYQQAETKTDCSELRFLLRWKREIEQERPTGPVEHLEHQLELAVALEDYEEAARLRDQIRLLRDKPAGRGHRG